MSVLGFRLSGNKLSGGFGGGLKMDLAENVAP